MQKMGKKFAFAALAAAMAFSSVSCGSSAGETYPDEEKPEAASVVETKENPEEATLPVNKKKFPDEVFRNYLIKEYDIDGDGFINPYSVTEISVGNLTGDSSKISSLRGIEYFPNLEKLYCEKNNLTRLDVSDCTSLRILDCAYNNLISLDVSGCTELSYLYCMNNNLMSLNVSPNKELIYLSCRSNDLTSLDVSRNPALYWLDCNDNNLTSLDVSQNPKLSVLDCGSNNLTSLDVSRNLSLGALDCDSNNLTSLDVSRNPSLVKLRCDNNNLTSLDLSNNTKLWNLGYDYDKISGLNLSVLTYLSSLNLHFQELPKSGTLDFSDLGYQVKGLDMGVVNYSLELDEYKGEYCWVEYDDESFLWIYANTLQDESSVSKVTGI